VLAPRATTSARRRTPTTSTSTDRQAGSWLALRGFQVVEPAQINDFPPDDSNYHNYQEMVADLQALAAQYPQFVRIISLGQSFEGP
jgi:hypothetical protein